MAAVNAVVFVVDATDSSRVEEAKAELQVYYKKPNYRYSYKYSVKAELQVYCKSRITGLVTSIV